MEIYFSSTLGSLQIFHSGLLQCPVQSPRIPNKIIQFISENFGPTLRFSPDCIIYQKGKHILEICFLLLLFYQKSHTNFFFI